jgi:cell wall-associated NlpC family hydrolase
MNTMKTSDFFCSVISIIILTGCSATRRTSKPETTAPADIHSTVVIKKKVPDRIIDTKNIAASDVVAFAKTLIGVKYKYGSTDKEKGFDCSGFVTYVFNHFNISVPRVSVDFTNAGINIPIEYSKEGDIILFTGSDAKSGIVGHMGIITENDNGQVKFIHASESRGVMISGMNSYFIPRFVKVNRIFTLF